MIRSAKIVFLLAVVPYAIAQENTTNLASLRQAADKAAANWDNLAKALEPKIVRLLPCDPSSRAAVEEVSRASDARLITLSAYLKAAAAQAKMETTVAKQVLAEQASIAGGWNTERAEADQERNGIEAQVAELKESMRKRGSLSEAQKVLVEISKMVKDRAAKSDGQAGNRDAISTLLGDMVVAYQDRQTALETEFALLDAESTKWTAYYIARLARATTECTVTRGPAARKKQP